VQVELDRVILLTEQLILDLFQLFRQLHLQVVEDQGTKHPLLLLIIVMENLADQVVVEQPHQVLVELVIHPLQLLPKETMVVLVFTLELILLLMVVEEELVELERMEVLEALVELAELE
tara:strand:+ start:115 stop:471 length:357 start_codon:yes stop_codon:yes gene_type:complete